MQATGMPLFTGERRVAHTRAMDVSTTVVCVGGEGEGDENSCVRTILGVSLLAWSRVLCGGISACRHGRMRVSAWWAWVVNTLITTWDGPASWPDGRW